MGWSRTVVARTPAEIDAIRASWQTFDLPTVHHDVDFYLAKLRARPAVLRPHVIMLERDGRPVAIGIGRLEEGALACKFGYRTVYRPTIRLLVMRPGFLFERDREDAGRELVAEVFASLAQGEADAVSFYGLESDSSLFRAATELPSVISRGRFVVREPHWKLELPESLDAFLASRSRRARGEIRGIGNRLARKYGARMATRVFRSMNELDQLFADLERVAVKTYQHALDAGFADTGERRETTALALSRGWFRAYVLYIDHEPVAYLSGFLYRGTFSGAQTGYDPAFRSDRVGTYLLMRLIEDLCQEDTARVVDFGCGGADYKRRFSSSGSEEAHPMVFAPTFTGIRVNATRTAIAAADELARKALERVGLLGAVKKRLRATSPAGRPEPVTLDQR